MKIKRVEFLQNVDIPGLQRCMSVAPKQSGRDFTIEVGEDGFLSINKGEVKVPLTMCILYFDK